MLVDLDIETVPDADREKYLQEARANFTVPSGLTKEQAMQELGLMAAKNLNKEQVLDLWAEQCGPAYADIAGDKAWRATALDGTTGRILSIAYQVEDQPAKAHIDEQNEIALLQWFFNTLPQDIGRHKPFFAGHNLAWDLKFIWRRAVILNVPPPFALPFKGRHGNDYWCTMEAWCGYGERITQDKLAKALGLPGKPDTIDGSKVCDYWLAGRYGEILFYNRDDVVQNMQIYRRQSFLV